jgi:hypothetical protein
MTNHRQLVYAMLAGAALFAAGPARADQLDAQAVQQFEAQQALAMKGNADSQYRIGEMYEQGLGTKRDPSMAFLWFNKAAIQGNPRAKEKLASLESKSRAESAEEQARVNAAMRALQQSEQQEVAKQKAVAEARRLQQQEDVARANKEKAAAEAAAAAAAAAAARAKAESTRVVTAPAAKPAAPEPVAAKPAAPAKPAPATKTSEADKAEFSANPCKGPQAKFLSTCQ